MRSRHYFWLLPLLFILAYPLWQPLAARLLDPGTIPGTSEAVAEKRVVMSGVHLSQSRGGVRELVLTADSLESKENQQQFELHGVKSRIFDPDTTYTVTGGEALYNSSEQTLTLMDRVRVINDKGLELKTEVLRLLTKYKMIKSAAPLTVHNEDFDISGTSFSYRLKSGDFRVGKRVKCLIYH